MLTIRTEQIAVLEVQARDTEPLLEAKVTAGVPDGPKLVEDIPMVSGSDDGEPWAYELVDVSSA